MENSLGYDYSLNVKGKFSINNVDKIREKKEELRELVNSLDYSNDTYVYTSGIFPVTNKDNILYPFENSSIPNYYLEVRNGTDRGVSLKKNEV